MEVMASGSLPEELLASHTHWVDTTVHKYTNTQIHKYTNANTQCGALLYNTVARILDKRVKKSGGAVVGGLEEPGWRDVVTQRSLHRSGG